MTRMRSELAPPPQTSAPNQRQIIWPSMYVLTCNRPHTGRIFSGIGFRTWNPKAPKPGGHRNLRRDQRSRTSLDERFQRRSARKPPTGLGEQSTQRATNG
ncbi:hypothetical protein AVEN_106019-1 [Araneus ventricosus]|uniref:Uncharacterized protein n=1 Tax=Araneus ventricosus TaxID=182803 RepID=A0A4Y2SHF7_ARAVE|nr:hypothetical protein AVEN_106019-1 [Araneus ventricosus]